MKVAAALLIACVACGASSARAQDSAADQAVRLKAAYFINFLKFTVWRDAASMRPLEVCVRGTPELSAVFKEAANGKLINGRRILFRVLTRAVDEDSLSCDAIYLSNEIGTAPRSVLSRREILTVSDKPSFIADGGMIGLFVEKNRLRFNVNLDTVRASGLDLQSGLLQLAASVEKRR